MLTKDNRTVAECTITWGEDRKSGRGYYYANFADGGRHEMPEETAGIAGPITNQTDSEAVAEAIAADLQLELLAVDHDGDFVHATMRQL